MVFLGVGGAAKHQAMDEEACDRVQRHAARTVGGPGVYRSNS